MNYATNEFNKAHLVECCTWDSTFDDEQQAVQLQNALSDWSHSEMQEILEDVLDSFCPKEETWRVDSVTVDLGLINYVDLESEISDRFKIGLQRSLTEIVGMQSHSSLQIMSNEENLTRESPKEALEHFLLKGILPWWARNEISHGKMLEQQLSSSPVALMVMLRRVGQFETARKRMVMQWRGPHIRKIVRVLEPHHHDYIEKFVDKVNDLQSEGSLGISQSSSFKQNIWFWILTYLIVDRGSQFNTVSFVRSTLYQLSQHYNVDYQELLQLIFSAIQTLDMPHNATPLFIQAIKILAVNSLPVPDTDKDADYWQVYESFLLNRQTQVQLAGQTLDFTELHVRLMADNCAKVCELLRSHSGRNIVHFLVLNLNKTELICLVEALVPTNAGVVIRFNETIEKLLHASQHRDNRNCWTLSLSELTHESKKSFDTRNYLKFMLASVCRTEKLSEGDLLISILHCDRIASASQTIEMHNALHQIRLETSRLRNNSSGSISIKLEALKILLATGQIPDGSPGRSQIENWRGLRVLLLDGMDGVKSTLQLLTNQTGKRALLATQLVELAGIAGIPRLFRVINSNAENFVLELISWLRLSRRDGLFPSLGFTDFQFDIYCLVVQALLSQPGGFSRRQFLDELTELLVSTQAVSRSAWLNNVEKAVQVEGGKIFDPEISRWIEDQRFIHDGPVKKLISNQEIHDLNQIVITPTNRDLIILLLKNEKFPDGFQGHKFNEPEFIEQLLKNDPGGFRAILVESRRDRQLMFRVLQLISVSRLLQAMQITHSAYLSDIKIIAKIFTWVSNLRIPHISHREIELVLSEKLFELWCVETWTEKSIAILIAEFTTLMREQNRTPLADVRLALIKEKHQLPPICLEYIELLKQPEHENKPVLDQSISAKNKPIIVRAPMPETAKVAEDSGRSIHINNAGIVLLNGFIETFYDRIGLLKGKQFVSRIAQMSAVHYLQYLATAQQNTEEQYLFLNKILCGLEPSEPVESGVAITQKEQNLSDSLIKALVGHWEGIGESSIEGFRGNWLVRDGMLIEQEDKWSLVIEQRAYDILLQRSPFTFSVIKLPWMDKPIYTTWMN